MKLIEAVLNTWEAISNPSFQSNTKRSSDGSRLTIEVMTKQYLAIIEAWESSYNMDVTAVELISNSGVLLSAGECTSLDEMKERIALLCSYFLKNHKSVLTV
jgi:hypothetical protein